MLKPPPALLPTGFPMTSAPPLTSPHSSTTQSHVSLLEARLVPVATNSATHSNATQQKHSFSLAVATTLFIGSLNTIDASSAALSLPHIAESLKLSNSIQWAGASYCVGLTVTTILLGRLGDAFGRKYVLSLGLTLLSISHIGTALLHNSTIFFICRGIAGMSSACIHSMTILMTTDLVHPSKRAKYQAYLGCALGIGDCVGPLMMAAFLQGPGWSWFYVTTSPILLLAAIVAVLALPLAKVQLSRKELLRYFDYAGLICITIFLVCLVVPLMNAGISWKWNEFKTIGLLVASFTSLVCFVIAEKLATIPIIPPRLVRMKGTRYMLCENFIIGVIFQPMQIYIPLYFTVVKGIEPRLVALMAMAWVIPLCASSLLAGFIVGELGYKYSIRLGLILWLVGLLWLAQGFGTHTSQWCEGLILALTGSGIGFVLQPSVIAVQAQAYKADRSVAVTTRNVFKSIGGTLGLSISSLIYMNTVQSSVTVSEKLIEETKDFVLQNLHSKQLASQLQTHEGEIIGALYTGLMLYLFFIWSNVLSLSLVFFVSPVIDSGIDSADEQICYSSEHEQEMTQTSSGCTLQRVITDEDIDRQYDLQEMKTGGEGGAIGCPTSLPMRDLGLPSVHPEQYGNSSVMFRSTTKMESLEYDDPELV